MRASKAPRLALIAVACGVTGCASWMRYTDHLADTAHPWHAWPERAGIYIGAAPIYPLAWLEAKAFHPSGNICIHAGVFGPLMAGTAALVGFPLGTAFYVVGYPLEWAFPLEERRRRSKDASESAAPPEHSEDQPDPTDPPE